MRIASVGPSRLDLHRPDKAIAIAAARLDQPLRVPAVPNRLASQRQAALERRITDVLGGPHLRT